MYLVIIGSHGKVIRRPFFSDDVDRIMWRLEHEHRSIFVKEYHMSNAL
jgi:hypothetical protein